MERSDHRNTVFSGLPQGDVSADGYSLRVVEVCGDHHAPDPGVERHALQEGKSQLGIGKSDSRKGKSDVGIGKSDLTVDKSDLTVDKSV